MAVLGIITCEIFEQEIAGLIAGDTAVSLTSVIEEPSAAYCISLLNKRGVPVQTIPHISAFRPLGSGLELLVKVMRLGMHIDREEMRKNLHQESLCFERHIDALFLIFGSCGGALSDPFDIADISCPLVFPEENGSLPADCISLCLGGDQEYDLERHKIPGTYYLTPGWGRHWPEMFGSDEDDRTANMYPWMCHRVMNHYKRLLVVYTSDSDTQALRKSAEAFSELSGLPIQERHGNTNLLRKSYKRAKEALNHPVLPWSETKGNTCCRKDPYGNS